MENKNSPAFPHPKQILGSGQDYHEINPAYGLTKREYFAAMAMQGITTPSADRLPFLDRVRIFFGHKPKRSMMGMLSSEDTAERAIQLADEILKQLDTNNQN